MTSNNILPFHNVPLPAIVLSTNEQTNVSTTSSSSSSFNPFSNNSIITNNTTENLYQQWYNLLLQNAIELTGQETIIKQIYGDLLMNQQQLKDNYNKLNEYKIELNKENQKLQEEYKKYETQKLAIKNKQKELDSMNILLKAHSSLVENDLHKVQEKIKVQQEQETVFHLQKLSEYFMASSSSNNNIQEKSLELWIQEEPTENLLLHVSTLFLNSSEDFFKLFAPLFLTQNGYQRLWNWYQKEPTELMYRTVIFAFIRLLLHVSPEQGKQIWPHI